MCVCVCVYMCVHVNVCVQHNIIISMVVVTHIDAFLLVSEQQVMQDPSFMEISKMNLHTKETKLACAPPSFQPPTTAMAIPP